MPHDVEVRLRIVLDDAEIEPGEDAIDATKRILYESAFLAPPDEILEIELLVA
jgi:hypothetical protein